MGERADRKKQLILQKAREVFAAKGYRAVTMKDIVDACGISRGGLYLYYPDVREVFLAVLGGERPQENEAAIDRVLAGDATVTEMLMLYLADRKREVLDGDRGLARAEYEFFSSGEAGEETVHPLKARFESAVLAVTQLITLGVKSGEFVSDAPESDARSIMYTLEGLRAAGQTFGVSPAEVDREIDHMLHRIRQE
ncbi:MAG: TetR/AcrR family transcriptional regulator [Lachnospiraceae bacterium]|nr:TetR/AcrR family transcriptional regulator [Lachnospiraceae bacterium]